MEKLPLDTLSVREFIESRLDAMDKAMDLFQANLTRVPTEVDRGISRLKELHEETFRVHWERFASIDRHFVGVEKLTNETDKLNQRAIEAALAAVTKQIDQLIVNMNTVDSALNDKISTLYDRINRNEGKGLGQNWIVGIVALGVVLDVVFRLAFKP